MIKASIKIACFNWNLRELCMPVGLNAGELIRVDELVAIRRPNRRGIALFPSEDPSEEKFTSLFALRTGFFKTCVTTQDGQKQVTGFQMVDVKQRHTHILDAQAFRRIVNPSQSLSI